MRSPSEQLRAAYKATLPVAMVMCTPALLFAGWYAWSAWAELDRYRRHSGETFAIDGELFHLALHDQLEQDLRRFFIGERPERSPLPTVELSFTRAAYDALLAQSSGNEDGAYVPALVREGGPAKKAEVRLRGRQPWQVLGAQKSLKVKLDKGELIDGVRVFNLLNDVTPFGLEEEIILGIAREQGLLTPGYRPVRVRINNADMGVYRFEAQPEEGLIRQAQRMPGSIYSGNIDATGAQTGIGELWGNLAAWQKAAARVPEEDETFDELGRLLAAVGGASHLALREYAAEELDLDRVALFEALDVVFGGEQHDFVSNHKLYFDPMRGRFEPIAWSFRGFTHDPRVSLVDNPLGLRLHALPEYGWRRNRAVYALLTGAASPAAVRARVEELWAALAPDLETDPYWDAYKLLARASRFHRFMLRPMSTGRWLLAAQAELRRFGDRNRFLLDLLEAPATTVSGQREREGVSRLEITVSGYAAYRAQSVTPLAPCAGAVTLYADVDGDGRRSALDPAVGRGRVGETVPIAAWAELSAGSVLVPRPPGADKLGTVTLAPAPRTYTYLITVAGCAATSAAVDLESLVTGATRRAYVDFVADGAPPPVRDTDAVDRVPALAAGESSPHPWAFPAPPAAQVVRLGPGEVTLSSTRLFAPHQTVVIPAGTRLRLGPGVSLIFRGRLLVEGTAQQPARIEAATEKPFGGLLLLGAGTAGSRLQHLEVRGGTSPRYRALYTPSLINVYDTADVTLEAVTVREASGSEDLLHATYVRGLALHDLDLAGAPIDAIDLEMCEAEIRGARIDHPGDECLDLMGSTVRIIDSALIGCAQSGISAGEESRVTVHGTAVVGAKTGILAKNAARVRLSRSLVAHVEQALRTNRREVHYDAPSSIDAEDLYAIGCDELTRAAPQTRIDLGDWHEEIPGTGELEYLRQRVLRIDDWSALEALAGGEGSP